MDRTELEKMIVNESQAFEKYDYGNSQEEQEDAFKEGALFMQGILMPEVERLKAKCDFQLFDNRVETLQKELSEAKARIDDLEKDRMRLEWMIEKEGLVVRTFPLGEYVVYVRDKCETACFRTPREAIDAAMESEKK